MGLLLFFFQLNLEKLQKVINKHGSYITHWTKYL